MLRGWLLLIGLGAAAVLPAGQASAQPSSGAPTPYVGENLLVTLPDGYKIDYSAKNKSVSITEMVPAAESVNDWTEMVTTQIFFGAKLPLQQFKARLEANWAKACSDHISHQIAEATENGYPVLVWFLTCPRNPQTGKPEWTWFKAIGGNDSLYVVQKAFKFEPSPEQVVRWTKYLKSVALCDSRSKERGCASPGK